MKRRIALCIAVSLCAGVYAGNNPGIYKKGWIDFNKNGVKDIYEDPSAPIEASTRPAVADDLGGENLPDGYLVRVRPCTERFSSY
jgi:hypothetical protein